MASDKHRKGLVTAYQRAGTNYLAYRLTRIFGKIETEADRILHNDMMEDIDTMIGGNSQSALRMLAGLILRRNRETEREAFLQEAAKALNNNFQSKE